MSFFERRVKPKPEPTPDPTRSLFSHSGGFLTQQKERIEREKRLAEKEKERELRKKEKKERKASVKRENSEGDSKERKPDLKRRRISSKESEKLLALSGLPSGPIELESSDDEAEQSSPATQVRRSPRHTRTATDDYGLSKPRTRLNHVTAVSIGDPDDAEVEITGSTSRQAPPSSEGEDEFSDPELAELSRKARRAARAQAQEKKALSSEANVLGGASDTAMPEQHDPIISIFITSDIPNTGQLLIRRKMSQPLGKVRLAWCERYKLPAELRDGVFLTFCGRRQYDSTTCQRLGLRVDAYGRTTREDGNPEEPNDQVHVEAFTEALFAERKAEQARQAKAGNNNYDVDEQEEPEPEPAPAEIRIVIKVKGKQKPFNLRVLPVSEAPFFVIYARAEH